MGTGKSRGEDPRAGKQGMLVKFIPHSYQKYCIDRMIADPVLGLFLDMGLGKTVITLTAINDLRYNRFAVGKVLVIAPKKVAEDTWTREAGKWDHLKLLRVMPVLGNIKSRIRALNAPGDIWVLSRDNVAWLVDYYKNDWPFDMVVIDELSSFKSNQAKRFRKLRSIRNHIQRIVGLTGTPTPNGLEDLWAQIYLLDQGERLGRTITSYRDNYFTPGARNGNVVYEYRPRTWAESEINLRIRDICISMKAEDYLELPERIDNVRHVKLPKQAQKQYQELERDMIASIDGEQIDVASAAALGNKLLQLCNGAVYDADGIYHEVHDEKIQALKEILEANQGKGILVFYSYKHDRERIRKGLSKMNLRIGELKNPDSITAWNSGQMDVLLAHPASAAYGLNLQAGGHVIVWFGLNWSLELYQQANARLYRQGQKENVIIHHLVTAGGYDENVMDALEQKGVTQDSFLEALKAKIKNVKKS